MNTLPTDKQWVLLDIILAYSPNDLDYLSPELQAIVKGMEECGWIRHSEMGLELTEAGDRAYDEARRIMDPAADAAVRKAVQDGVITAAPHWKRRPDGSMDPNEEKYQEISMKAGLAALRKATAVV